MLQQPLVAAARRLLIGCALIAVAAVAAAFLFATPAAAQDPTPIPGEVACNPGDAGGCYGVTVDVHLYGAPLQADEHNFIFSLTCSRDGVSARLPDVLTGRRVSGCAPPVRDLRLAPAPAIGPSQ